MIFLRHITTKVNSALKYFAITFDDKSNLSCKQCIVFKNVRLLISKFFDYTLLNDQLNLDVISVKAFPHFSAICCNCRFVNFNCFLSIMLFALELLPLRTLMPTNTYAEGILFLYAIHFCARMHQTALLSL